MNPSRELYPLVMVDVALFSMDEGDLRVLLVQRAQEPELRRWSLPGGFLKPALDQDLEAAARRVLRDKVSVEVPHLEEVRCFSGPDRDPRGWSISVLFYALLPSDKVNALIRNKVEALEWADATKLGHRMAFDHEAQLATALQVLRDKVGRRALPLHLMAEEFTLTELQRTCEAILGCALDKSVFRRRIKGLPKEKPDLVTVRRDFTRGAQRPPELYRARDGFTWS